MKKIVIHCATGIMNSGDEAILDVLVHGIGEQCQITVISLNAEYTKKMHQGIAVIDNKDPDWKRVVDECDVFILGGGGLLQDTTTIYNVWRWLGKLKYAIKQKKKTMVFANSFEPIRYDINKFMMKKWLNKVDVITVRDAVSKDILEKLGVKNVLLTADPVFSYEKQLSSEKKYPEKYITIAIRHWYDTHPLIPVSICNKLGIRTKANKEKYNNYVQKIADVVTWVNRELDMPVMFLSFCVNRDDKVANDILQRVENKEKNIVVNEMYITPSEMMDYIGHSRLLIGMRLHSLIYACVEKTPMVILAYQEKVRGIAKELSLTDVCLDVDTFSAQDMICSVQSVCAHGDEQRMLVENYAEKMKHANADNFKYFFELLKRG